MIVFLNQVQHTFQRQLYPIVINNLTELSRLGVGVNRTLVCIQKSFQWRLCGLTRRKLVRSTGKWLKVKCNSYHIAIWLFQMLLIVISPLYRRTSMRPKKLMPSSTSPCRPGTMSADTFFASIPPNLIELSLTT